MMGVLNGVIMEIEDLSLSLVKGERTRENDRDNFRWNLGVVATDNDEIAFKDVDVALFVGAMPRKEGMERKDLLK